MNHGYYLPRHLIVHNPMSGISTEPDGHFCGVPFSVLEDRKIFTCANVSLDGRHLQAMLDVSDVSHSHNLSVKVTLKNSEGCNTPAWTWFTGSDCVSDLFMECKRTLLGTTWDVTFCGVSCVCLDTCNKLVVKYNGNPRNKQTGEKLCEISIRWWGLTSIWTLAVVLFAVLWVVNILTCRPRCAEELLLL